MGLQALSKKSYYDDLTNKKVRVDVDVVGDVAFIDEPLPLNLD